MTSSAAYRIDATQLHSREINYHAQGRSRTVALTGCGDAAAMTWAIADLVTAGTPHYRAAAPTMRHPSDWPPTGARGLAGFAGQAEAVNDGLNAALGWALT